MPQMGGVDEQRGLPALGGLASGLRNECSPLLVSLTDRPVPMDHDTPQTAPNRGSSDFGRESGETSDWNGVDAHQAGDRQDVQRTLRDLAIGSTTYGNNILNGGYSNNGSHKSADTGLSPDTASNRLTPNSTTPSDTRSILQPGQPGSGGNSYQSSPAPSHHRPGVADNTTASSFFPPQSDFSNLAPTGMTPDNTYNNMAEAANGWDVNNQNTTGLTPIGEGVFRQLMGLDPM